MPWAGLASGGPGGTDGRVHGARVVLCVKDASLWGEIVRWPGAGAGGCMPACLPRFVALVLQLGAKCAHRPGV